MRGRRRRWKGRGAFGVAFGAGIHRRRVQRACSEKKASEGRGDDDELVVNPPTPCKIGKHPPAPKKNPAGQQASKGRA